MLTYRWCVPRVMDFRDSSRVLGLSTLANLAKPKSFPLEIKVEWGKGLAQKREAEARLDELGLQKTKPFARTRRDSELVLPDIGDNEKMKESGFIVPQEAPKYSWLKRGLDAAPNRYGIRPGRHWDGVDRSNGFENKMFHGKNEKQATEREAYMCSVFDM
ncbi:BUD13-like protein [Artemisia annua]|uniref:BUD13-like protein n=1 Tax=Artemisia annua TaxID=35608 RepID=A0A2U1PIG7_ARTAN|nr:BUD13-like protein [Artemisia annua]